jgi:predicted RNA-binding protein YlxR (DUF448 family)
LLRIVASGSAATGREVVPDPSATLPGRGAWVHPTTACIENAAKRRAFGRALRVTEVLDIEQLKNIIPSVYQNHQKAD